MTQSRWNSFIFWLGLIVVIVQEVTALLIGLEILTPIVAAAVVAVFAGILQYCNANNPSLKDTF